MAERKSAARGAKQSTSGFTKEERAAMRERVKEMRSRARTGKVDGAVDLKAKIAAMAPADRKMAERIDALVRAHAPTLTPRTWYGMPAYSKDDQVVLFFRPAEKFKTRYATLGFSDEAQLDDGHMWPTDFALIELTAAEEARIAGLLKRAVG